MTRVYYKEAVGAFIVFDVTRRNTFESVTNWKSDLDSKVQLLDGSPIPCVLLANKVSVFVIIKLDFIRIKYLNFNATVSVYSFFFPLG